MKCIKYIGQNGWAIFLEVYKQKLHFNIIWPERERKLGREGTAFLSSLELLEIYTGKRTVFSHRQKQRTQERSSLHFGPIEITKYSQILGQNRE